MIQLSHSFRGYPPVTAIDALNQARIWDVGLHVIPDDDLPQCFTRALERLEEGQAFGANLVRAQFTLLQKERREQREKEQQAKSKRNHDAGISFAEWFEKDREWIREHLPEKTQSMMFEMFDKRKAKENAR